MSSSPKGSGDPSPSPKAHGFAAPGEANARPAPDSDLKDRKVDASPSPAVAGGERPEEAVHSIVGIGASAGGLEAFSQVLQALDSNTGMAFVFVQHLAPKHESFLSELLSTNTSLPVHQVQDGMMLRRNHVYVIPPNAHLNIENGRLRLVPRPSGRAQHMPIDAFMRSLAAWADGNAIGVVLSGTASDGAAGLREIKAVGGITIVQDPATAKYDGMPRAAIATDAVDFVLSPGAIAAELLRLSRHPFVKGRLDGEVETGLLPDVKLHKIYTLLRKNVGCDFSQYKTSTILRRLQRRMALHKVATLDQYVRYLEGNTSEVHHLYEDILIHVTQFFREPDSFEALRTTVLPRLLEKRRADDPLRFWVPGCSTGEEAYSLAIATLELLDDESIVLPLQVFATDISEAAIHKARAGSYPESIAADVSPERLRRFFSRTGGRCHVSKAVRDACVFARQDVTRDPPFSRIDLILCRNLLIYLGLPLQRRLIQMFHYGLKPGGFLVLGSAETVGAQADLFTITSKAHRIYARKDSVARASVVSAPSEPPEPRVDAAPRATRFARPAVSLLQEASQALVARYVPPGVIVDEDLRIVQFRGQTGAYLEPAPGDASLHLLKMVREGLLNGTRSAIQEARKTSAVVRRIGLTIRHDDKPRRVDVVVVPLTATTDGRHFAVLFEEPRAPAEEEAPAGRAKTGRRGRAARHGKLTPKRRAEVIEQLKQELAASRDYLQSINQDLEAANEELQSANEEILSNNEELQSTNEELDTAKEEMQSTNEELNTVNDELRARNEELAHANSDLVNLLASVQIAIVIVGSNLRIRRFTPMAEKVLNLIPSDIGRPLGDIKPNIDQQNLDGLIAEVIDTMATKELEVKDRQGRPYSMRIRPYKNIENRIDGAVLALFDVNAPARDEKRLREALDLVEHTMEVAHEPLVALNDALQIERVNSSFLRLFGLTREQALGLRFCQLTGGKWNVADIRAQLEAVSPKLPVLECIPIEYEFPRVGRRTIALNVRRVERADGGKPLLLLAFEGLDVGIGPRREAKA